MLLLILLAAIFSPSTISQKILSSCPQTGLTELNNRNVGRHLRSWLKSVTSVSSQEDEGGLKSMRYYPLKASYGAHYDTEDVSDFHDNPTDTGGPFEDEDLDPVKDTDAEKGFVTIGHFEAGQPRGLAWQWRSERDLEGFLYGDLDDNRGRGFTGEDILYLYPDLVTGLRGRFRDGEAVEVRSVLVTSERCNQGVKEVKTKPLSEKTTWRKWISNATHISEHPQNVEPHERRSVYIGTSLVSGGGEGIFARRSFLPGELVSFFNGVRVTEEMMFRDNMTKEEEYETGRYYFGLGGTAPFSWGIHQELNLDIPERFRSYMDYRTTLGHKVNHKFAPSSNADFMAVKHPLFGAICGLVANKPIALDEEVFVDYNYDTESSTGPHWEWYRQLREKHDQQQADDHNQQRLEKKLKSEMLRVGAEDLFSEAH